MIAILGVLASLLLPVVRAALDGGRRAACQNNLKQMGATALLLAQEGPLGLEPGYLPPRDGWIKVDGRDWYFSWFGLLAVDMGLLEQDPAIPANDLSAIEPKALFCPSADRDVAGWTNNTFPYGYYWLLTSTLAVDRILGHVQRLSTIDNVAKRGMLGDSDENGRNDYIIGIHSVLPFSLPYPDAPGERHRGGGNLVFVDGHVEWLPYEMLAGTNSPFRIGGPQY